VNGVGRIGLVELSQMAAGSFIVERMEPEFEGLYHRAFAEYGLRALWNQREVAHPTPDEALTVTRSLRVEGDLGARRLAEELEEACRAAF
jgi:hypothetical protein